jgi:hypothetical protein
VPTQDVKLGIPMCTPYTEMIRVRDDALAAADLSKMRTIEAGVKSDAAEVERNAACSSMVKMQKKMGEMEAAMMQLVKSCESQVAAEKKQRDADVQSIIAQHNLQLSELKRLHKAIAAKQSASAAAALSIVSASTTRESPAPPTDILNCSAAGGGGGTGTGGAGGGTVAASSHPFRAIHGAPLHTTSIPHPTQHSNRSSAVPLKGHATAPHTGQSTDLTLSTSQAGVQHPVPSSYRANAPLQHSASSNHVKSLHNRSDQQQSSESTTQGLDGPHSEVLQREGSREYLTEAPTISSKSHRALEHTVAPHDGGAVGSEHPNLRGSLSLASVSESCDDSDVSLDNRSSSASRQTQTEGYLQPSLMHLSPHESRSGMKGRNPPPRTFDHRYDSQDKLSATNSASGSQNSLYASSHHLLPSSEHHSDLYYNSSTSSSFLSDTHGYDNYNYTTSNQNQNQNQYYPRDVPSYSAFPRSLVSEEVDSSVSGAGDNSLNPYKYYRGDFISTQRQQSDELDLNDAESRYCTVLYCIVLYHTALCCTTLYCTIL